MPVYNQKSPDCTSGDLIPVLPQKKNAAAKMIAKKVYLTDCFLDGHIPIVRKDQEFIRVFGI
jgi:hypothetical protein